MPNALNASPPIAELLMDFRFDEELLTVNVHSNFRLRLAIEVSFLTGDTSSAVVQAFTPCCGALIILDDTQRCSECGLNTTLDKDWSTLDDVQPIVERLIMAGDFDPLERTMISCAVFNRIVEVGERMLSVVAANGWAQKSLTEIEHYCKDASGLLFR